MTDTNLSQAVEATNDASSYDTNVKFLLADKQILARILKYAVQEFKEMDVNDIMASIGDDIAIGSKPLDAGLSNLGRVHTSNTEDNIPVLSLGTRPERVPPPGLPIKIIPMGWI